MRVSKAETEKKNALALTLMTKDPLMSMAKINDEIKAKCGTKLNVNRLQEIRSQVTGSKNGRKGPKKGSVATGKRPPHEVVLPTNGVKLPQIIHLVDGEPAPELLARTLDTLRATGASNLAVVSKTDRYVLVDIPVDITA